MKEITAENVGALTYVIKFPTPEKEYCPISKANEL